MVSNCRGFYHENQGTWQHQILRCAENDAENTNRCQSFTMPQKMRATWEQEKPEYGRAWLAKFTRSTACGTLAWSEHGWTMIGALKTVFAQRLRELDRQARAQQVKNWAWRAQFVETWIDHANEVLIEAQAEERVAEQRRGTHATKPFSQWLETAIEKRARVAHRWTTQTTTSAHTMDYQNSTTPHQSMQARTEECGSRWKRGTEARHILLRQMHSLSTLYHATQLCAILCQA